MIDLRELDRIKDDGYPILETKDGQILKVTLAKEKHMVTIGNFQQEFVELYNEQKELMQKDKRSKEVKRRLAELNEKMFELCQEEFLYIINMNTAGVKLTLEDIENIPIQQVKEEVEGYLKYVTDHLKNSLSPQTIQMRNKKNI